MRPRARQNIDVTSGDDKVVSLTAMGETGAVVNLTSATALTFKAGCRLGEPYEIQKTLGSGVAVVSAAAGTYSVTLLAADTEYLEGDLVYDVAATIGGLIQTVSYGRLRIYGDVT